MSVELQYIVVKMWSKFIFRVAVASLIVINLRTAEGLLDTLLGNQTTTSVSCGNEGTYTLKLNKIMHSNTFN